MTTRVLLGGGTGLVGGLLTERLLARPDETLTSLVRHTKGAAHETAYDFEALAADPEAEAARLDLPPCDVGVSCLGSTIAKAKTQAAFRRVDHDYVLAVAKAAKALGARRFVLVSSVGAKAGSGNFYLAVKGGIEVAVAALGFDRLDILRPGLILGPRADRRPAEAWAQRVAAWVNPAVRAVAPDYAAVRAEDVAGAIAALLAEGESGRHVHGNRNITSRGW